MRRLSGSVWTNIQGESGYGLRCRLCSGKPSRISISKLFGSVPRNHSYFE